MSKNTNRFVFRLPDEFFGALIHRLILVLVLLSSSCKKEDDHDQNTGDRCDGFSAPYASNDGPVQEGQPVQLFANTSETDVEFHWTGPGNFDSEDQNPVISYIAFSGNGNYFVQMSNSKCISNQSYTSVTVTEPCSNNDNQGIFDSAPWNFTSVLCDPGANGLYKITATSANGTLNLYFNKLASPAGFVIFPVDGTTNPSFDSTKVQVRIIPAGGLEFIAPGGSVYFANAGSLIKASFCILSFYSSVNGVTISGKSRLICN